LAAHFGVEKDHNSTVFKIFFNDILRFGDALKKFHGTPVEKHWSRQIKRVEIKFYIEFCIIFS
jgi:hypothetical protein